MIPITTNNTVAERDALEPSNVQTPEEAAASDAASLPTRRNDAWKSYLDLPDTATKAERLDALRAAMRFGDLGAADAVDAAEASLGGALEAWRHTARVAYEMNAVTGLSIPTIARELGATEKVKASEMNGKRVDRLINGWAAVKAAGAEKRGPDALRPFVVFGNLTLTNDKRDASLAAIGTGRSVGAVMSDIREARAITTKAAGTPRLTTVENGAETTPETPETPAEPEQVNPGDVLALVTADVLAASSERQVASLVTRVVREARTRHFKSADVAASIAKALRDAADRIAPEVTDAS